MEEKKRELPWLKGKRGWLKNKERLERRNRPKTLTDAQVMELIHKIDEIDHYTKLPKLFDSPIRLRDKALIALSWIFFKRGSETLRTKFKDFYFDDKQLEVTFSINKKSKRVKTCPSCGEKNAKKSTYCRSCGCNITYVEPIKKKEESFIVTKHKNIEYPFCRHFVEWTKILEELGCKSEHYVFPPFIYLKKTFEFSKHLTVQRFDQILQRLDITLTSHMFRYGHSEKLFRLGYTPFEVKEVGDWQSSRMPELYAKRKGFTVSQRKFAEDTRMVE